MKALPKVDEWVIWWKFSCFNRILFYYPAGPKFAQNRSISRRFQRYLQFLIFCKNSRWPPKVVKIENFHVSTEYSSTTLWVQNSLEIALSLTVSEIFAIFRKNSRWPHKVVKFEIFHIATEYSCTTLRVKNSLEIALSLTVFKIFALFVFCKKTVKETPTAAILFLSRYPE